MAIEESEVMSTPIPTVIYRIMHVDNLSVCLERGGLHAPNHAPDDGLEYKTIHNAEIQVERQERKIRSGAGGVIHDYVPFYLGPRSPMLLQLHTGWVPDYDEGQEPIIYLISLAQAVQESGAKFTFSDGHGIAAWTTWYDSLDDLDKVDWDVVYARVWRDTVADMDKQRRKQAEFLVYQCCDWSLIHEISVLNECMKAKIQDIMNEYPTEMHRCISVREELYY